MRKLVKLLMSVAAGLNQGLETYTLLNTPEEPEPEARGPMGFSAGLPNDSCNFVQPPPSPWLNRKK
jgi:hypothetical protein